MLHGACGMPLDCHQFLAHVIRNAHPMPRARSAGVHVYNVAMGSGTRSFLSPTGVPVNVAPVVPVNCTVR